jgi:hypothetical protein
MGTDRAARSLRLADRGPLPLSRAGPNAEVDMLIS